MPNAADPDGVISGRRGEVAEGGVTMSAADPAWVESTDAELRTNWRQRSGGWCPVALELEEELTRGLLQSLARWLNYRQQKQRGRRRQSARR